MDGIGVNHQILLIFIETLTSLNELTYLELYWNRLLKYDNPYPFSNEIRYALFE